MIKFSDLLDTRKCYEMIKLHRWPEGVICPHCDSSAISLRSEHHRHAGKNRYQCKNCHRRFDDLSLSVFSGHHQPLKVWVHCLYLMSLNISNLQIAKELGLHQGDVQKKLMQKKLTPLFLPMNTLFIMGLQRWATVINKFVIVQVNTLEMKAVTDFMRYR